MNIYLGVKMKNMNEGRMSLISFRFFIETLWSDIFHRKKEVSNGHFVVVAVVAAVNFAVVAYENFTKYVLTDMLIYFRSPIHKGNSKI
jgi:hypothetical protein